jgi:hypothetical protein
MLSRRSLLSAAALPLLGACSTPLPLGLRPERSAAAEQRLADSAQTHGLAAYRQIKDINVSYGGQWRPLIHRIQPDVVDAGFRGGSEERLLPAAATVAQAYTGPQGRKQVVWQRGRGAPLGDVAVWFNGVKSDNPAALQAAALVAECYGLFLLGPLWLHDRGLPAQLAGTERVAGRLCDVVNLWLSPGLGQSQMDRVALCIDRADSITRRMRFTLEGAAGTRGAVAETDTHDHALRFGVLWPMRSFERVVHPISLPAHDWHITGLDVNRGYPPQAVMGLQFTGLAAEPAQKTG